MKRETITIIVKSLKLINRQKIKEIKEKRWIRIKIMNRLKQEYQEQMGMWNWTYNKKIIYGDPKVKA
jgi:hypothetical protein